MFRLGYNTNGLVHNRLRDSLVLLAEIGYQAVAITPDVGHLDPFHVDLAERRAIRELALELDLELVIETGARYLLDPRRKHFPTLLESDRTARGRRIDFQRSCTDLASEVGAGLVSVWSGRAPDGVVAGSHSPSTEAHWDRLCEGMEAIIRHASELGVRVSFEPEPGMFIERPAGYRELVERLGSSGEALGLTLDVGHLLCTGDLPVERVVLEYGARLWNVHLDDIRGGVHRHRMFGTGDLDLPEVINALKKAGYGGVASVELSRDSHRGPDAATESMEHLQQALHFSP
jgi:L-ribulose-5-phosphate 3-epimerase